ncbi:MAG TPA: Ni-sirohydrochlorin a,c-diamide synthase, partial [Candidatus Methanoperedenaceae archaeon]|nr:Ni-sirohydrochlorin a,c-diamide synthase [Candidatus Methanoperedenaceae archaeon]
ARDEAFCFYYPENIDILRELGAEVVEFSPIKDPFPDADGLYLGGGYPELFAKALNENVTTREAIKQRTEEGMPLYAECGGMMYTLKEVDGYKMLDIFDAKAKMRDKLQAVGYVIAETRCDTILAEEGKTIKGHEFHYTEVAAKNVKFGYRMIRGKGITDGRDGMMYKNVLASYTHIHAISHPEAFIKFVRLCYDR